MKLVVTGEGPRYRFVKAEMYDSAYSGRVSHAQIEASSPGGNLLPLS